MCKEHKKMKAKITKALFIFLWLRVNLNLSSVTQYSNIFFSRERETFLPIHGVMRHKGSLGSSVYTLLTNIYETKTNAFFCLERFG
jgi:hypothetical protein